MDIFWGHAFSELFFWGSSIILSNFLGFAHFLGNLFISIKIRVAYTYVLQGLKIQFCLRPCLMTGCHVSPSSYA